jgi:hypothetical protein
MAELGEGLSGYLDVQDATLRAPRLEAVSNIGIANTAPQHAFSVGSNLYIDTESSNVLTVDGNVVCEGVKVGLIEIIPSYDLAAVSNVGNVTQSTIQFSNATTGFVTTANIEVGTANLFVDTTTSRVGVNTATPDASLHVTGNAYVSSNLEVGTANLFVDTVSGRVGVGTDDPGAELHVMGDIIGRSISKTRTITKGASLSDETETFTLNPDENRIVLNNNQGSIGSTRIYRANFTSGVPTTVGTVLHLEINSQRVNTDGVGRGHQSVIQFDGTSILDTGYIVLGATGGNDSYDRQLQRTIILTDDGWKDYSMYPKISAPTTDDAIIFSTTEHAISTDLGNTELTERMRITNTGNVGIGTTSPAAMLDVNGTARLSNIQRTAYMEELSKTFYFISGGSGTNNAVLLEINVNSSAVNDQREFAGTIDLHIVAQRTSSSHNVDCFNGQLHFVVGWNEQIDAWQVREFNQETKASHTGSYRVLESRPVFRYKYVNRRLQIYVQYAYNMIGARHSYVARVTADRGASSDVSIVSETSLMATGTDIQAGIGLCYDQGGNAGLGTNAPGSFRLNVNGSLKCIGAVDTSSDDRIKYNEEDIPNALTLVSQLKPQKYEKIMEIPQNTQGKWIPTDAEWESVKDEYKHGDEFGFIAQDVRAVPELSFLVHGEETQTDTKTLTPEEYSNLTTEEKNTYTVSYTYVSTEDPISAEEYSKLTTEEQSGYYQISDESVYKKWDIDAITYSNLIPKVQQTYTQTVGGYTKQIENQTPLSLNYNGLFVVAIGAIKELKAKNDALEARITALENA